MKKYLGRAACWTAAILQEAPGQLYARWKTWQIKGREMTFPLFSAALPAGENRPKVLVVVTHYAEPDPLHASGKADKLTACLDGAQQSLSHCDLKIVVNTTPDRHVRDEIAPALRDSVEWRMLPTDAPMYLGFRAVEWMLDAAGEYQFYLFLEDDIVIEDAMFLEKIAAFQAAVNQANWLLMPNRFEYYQRRKNYIDLGKHWSALSEFHLGEFHFAENVNPHSGAFVLNDAQIARVKASAKRLHGRDSFTGPRESAATGWLLEHFRIFNPAPPNRHFLEVRHWDHRYSRAALPS